ASHALITCSAIAAERAARSSDGIAFRAADIRSRSACFRSLFMAQSPIRDGCRLILHLLYHIIGRDLQWGSDDDVVRLASSRRFRYTERSDVAYSEGNTMLLQASGIGKLFG